jgi:hypothetical protein
MIEGYFPRKRAAVLRSLSSNLTASILLVHAVLGCCWHHAHAGGEFPARLVVCVSHNSPIDSDAPGRGHAEQSRDKHSGHDDCKGSKCIYVASLRVCSAQPTGSHEHRALPGTSAVDSMVFVAWGEQRSAANELPAPHTRLHLVKHVLLI